jgi:glyoxylase-like metal-dependent hydrolase (beta-lactamase superfamily II)
MERADDAAGVSVTLEPGLRRVLAPNPSPMTFRGTNSYIVGEGEVALIDPGPMLDSHRAALLAALAPGERIGAILLTHSHLDHSPLAAPLAEDTGAPVLAAGPSDWGRSAVMEALAQGGALGGGEGVDAGFAPTQVIAQGDTVRGGWGEIEVIATPGHMANHLSFAWRGALFSGDMVMGWSTSLVSPPDGDMTAFMASLEVLGQRADRIYYPGHGDPVTAPCTRVAELIAHRKSREAQIRVHLDERGHATAEDLARAIYTDVAPALIPAATRNVLAHLIDLLTRNEIGVTGDVTPTARFHLH